MMAKINAFILWIVFKALWRTWDLKLIESKAFKEAQENKEPIILAHWHGDELALLITVPKYKFSTITSTSKDGELMTQLLSRLGARASRGSSTRGGVRALKGLIRLMQSGNPACIAVDGPKGPIYKVKPGVFEVAKIAKAKVFTFSSAASSAFQFNNAWNKVYIPKPFSRVVIEIGPDFLCVDKSMSAKDPKLPLLLEKQLADAKHKVSKLIAQ